MQQLDNDLGIYNAAIERASQNLKAKSKDEADGAAYLIAAQSMADHAQKDMNWKKALDSEHRKPAIEALNNELTSLQKTILTEVFPTDPTYEVAVLNATPGRLLLDIKRSGKYKVRGVKHGFRENTFAPLKVQHHLSSRRLPPDYHGPLHGPPSAAGTRRRRRRRKGRQPTSRSYHPLTQSSKGKDCNVIF